MSNSYTSKYIIKKMNSSQQWEKNISKVYTWKKTCIQNV